MTRTRGARAPREKLPTEVPLDDGVREGPEAWREVDGVKFCHWDRWLLRLSLEEPEGLRSITREFRGRARAPHRTNHVAEAMLAQLADLERRLAGLARTPAALLDDVERESKWLRDKAFRRVWHATSIRRTPVMERVPRKALAARARQGNWAAFPISPAPYFERLCAIFAGGYFDYRGVGAVVLLLELEEDQQLAAARSDEERLAIRRAIIGASIEGDGACR